MIVRLLTNILLNYVKYRFCINIQSPYYFCIKIHFYLCVRPPNTCEVIYLEVLGAGGRGAEATVLLEGCIRLDKNVRLKNKKTQAKPA